ncbi:MAG: exo-alpha-sialidase [Bacteroidales bacterium]
MNLNNRIVTLFVLLALVVSNILFCNGQTINYPDRKSNPLSPIMLAGDWVPENTHDINFSNLPHISSTHSVISDVRYAWGTKTNQHNYLTYFDGQYWAMWSDGPGVPHEEFTAREHRNICPGHDRPGQMVSYSTSKNGIDWTEPRYLTDPPFIDGFGWIARGFWIRDEKLLALVTLYNAPNYRGEGLQLHAYEMVSDKNRCWQHKGLVYDNAMNNFPPKMLPNGEWMMSRRDSVGDVHMLIGGAKEFDKWKSVPIINYLNEDVRAEEPYWLLVPDNNLVAFFRDNKRSGFLFRAFSKDNGDTWTRPVRTNFPDATSKFSGLRLKDGRYVIVSNSNPQKRDPLTIAISDDGLVFNKMGYLIGWRHIDYPHVIEHDGYLLVAFAGAKQTVEVLKIPIEELNSLKMPSLQEIVKK